MNRAGTLAGAFILLSVACGGASANPSAQITKGSLATPNPLTVQVTADLSRAARAVIGPAGGQVTAGSASGAAMTLVIPPGALLSSHTVTVTPLTSVTALPLSGGLLAGVQLGPDGLLLVEPATLKITLPAGPPGGMKAYGFGFRHNGAELHLMKASGGATLTLTVWHFSGAGVGAGTSSDASSQAAGRPPTAPQDQVEQAQAVGQNVIPLLLGWDAELTGELGQSPNLPLLDLIYQQILAFGPLAIAAGRPDLADTLYTKIALVLQTASQTALTNCRSLPSAVDGLRVIRWIEWAQGHASILQHLDVAGLESGVVKCLRFQLDFMTTLDFEFGEGIHLSAAAKGIELDAVTAVPLKFAPAIGDLKYGSFKWIAGIPYTVSFTVNRPFSVQDVSMDLDAGDSADPSAVVDGMSVNVDFGDTTETIHVTAPFPVPPLPLHSFYTNGMQNMHHDEAVGPHLYGIAHWTAGAEPVFATLHETCPCQQVPGAALMESQDTTWRLRHTPQ